MSGTKQASPTARMRAERADQQARERDIVKAETAAAAKAVDDRTVRLRALRLEKEKTDGEAAEAAQAAKAAAKKPARARKPQSAKEGTGGEALQAAQGAKAVARKPAAKKNAPS